MRRVAGVVVPVAAFCLWVPCARAQQDGETDLAKGKEVLGRLSRNASDPAADRAIFEQN